MRILDGPLWLNSPIVDIIHPQTNEFGTGAKIKSTSDSKLNESPGDLMAYCAARLHLVVRPFYYQYSM